MHVGEIEFVFTFILEKFAVFVCVIFLHGLFQAPTHIFVARKQYRSVEIRIAYFRTETISAALVKFGILFHVFRSNKVNGAFLYVVFVLR